MSSRIKITTKNVADYFYLEKLIPEKPPVSFVCPISEYNDYLLNDAIRSLKDHVAKTWLLCEKKTGKIAAYPLFYRVQSSSMKFYASYTSIPSCFFNWRTSV